MYHITCALTELIDTAEGVGARGSRGAVDRTPGPAEGRGANPAARCG